MKQESLQLIWRVLNWPAVKVENVSALQDYTLFLRGCNNAMSDLFHMRELSNCHNHQKYPQNMALPR